MHVFLVDEKRPARDTVSKILLDAKSQVDVCDSGAAALLRLERGEAPDVILIKWGIGVAELVTRIRAYQGGQRAYVIALLERFVPADVAAVYAAGLDDFVRAPVIREELLGRVGAPERARARLGLEAPTALRDWSGAADLEKITAFKNMGPIVADVVGQMTGPLEITEVGLAQLSPGDRGAYIPLALAAQEVELGLTIITDAAATRWLADTILGSPEADAAQIDDMLKEMSNMAAGMVKRAAMADEITLTTGLPIARAADALEDSTVRYWSALVVGTQHRITIIGEIRSRKNRHLQASRLREGMVVVHDLKTGLGALVVPAGTRLTASMVTRIGSILGAGVLVEVSEDAQKSPAKNSRPDIHIST